MKRIWLKRARDLLFFSSCMALLSCATSEMDMEKERPGSYLMQKGSNTINDSDLRLSRKEFEEKLLPKTQAQQPLIPNAAPPIPQSLPLLVTPRPDDSGMERRVSLSVTEDIPLKDVLMELARLGDMDIELDPDISGGIILRVKDKPFKEVIERIATLANLRYTYENHTLRIERDVPYIETYRVDFLNIIRSGESSSSINTKVIADVTSGQSGGGGGGGGGSQGALNTGTTSNLSSSYDGNLWASVQADLARILSLDPKDPDKAEDTRGRQQTPNEAEVLGSIDGTVRRASATPRRSSFLSINRQAGIISALGTSRQQKAIANYLDRIKKSVSSQVLIEAKIVEITLDKQYRTGINWNLVDKNLGLSFSGGFTTPTQGQTDLVTFGVLNNAGTDMEAALRLTELFGTSRTISSPRLHAINNQQATLSFAFNQVFFTLDVQEQEDQLTSGGTTRTLNIDSQINTVPIGAILNLQPSIDPDNDEITMNIRPTLSRIRSQIDDPGVAIIAARNGVQNVRSSIPIVEVRELDSVLKIKSGQIMVIGGLMEERSSNNETGIPVLSTTPIIGKLFKGTAKDTSVVETVVFIKATIVPGYGVSGADQNLYKNFIRDPRPLAF